MEVTVHLDGDPAIREEGFFASQVGNLLDRVRGLEFDNAELVKTCYAEAHRVSSTPQQ